MSLCVLAYIRRGRRWWSRRCVRGNRDFPRDDVTRVVWPAVPLSGNSISVTPTLNPGEAYPQICISETRFTQNRHAGLSGWLSYCVTTFGVLTFGDEWLDTARVNLTFWPNLKLVIQFQNVDGSPMATSGNCMQHKEREKCLSWSIRKLWCCWCVWWPPSPSPRTQRTRQGGLSPSSKSSSAWLCQIWADLTRPWPERVAAHQYQDGREGGGEEEQGQVPPAIRSDINLHSAGIKQPDVNRLTCGLGGEWPYFTRRKELITKSEK